MTRIPHESPELESWLAEAKKADVALTPGPAELESLGVRLSSLHTGTALLGAPLAKVIAGIGTAALLGGVALSSGLGREASSSPSAPLTPALAITRARPQSTPASGSVSLGSTEHAVTSSNSASSAREAPESAQLNASSESPVSAHAVRSDSRPRATWIEVNEALSAGNIPAALNALENIIAHSGGTAKERAELAWAQLEVSGPRAPRATLTLQRLARSAHEASVRERARSVLGSSR